MKIILLSDDAVRLEPVSGPMTIEAPSAEQSYSPFHMLGSALATCTFSVVMSWATHAGLDVTDLAVEVRWQFTENPHRVGALAVTLDWPSLPPQRGAAARRVAELCTVHATLLHSPTIAIALAGESGAAAPEHEHAHASASATRASGGTEVPGRTGT